MEISIKGAAKDKAAPFMNAAIQGASPGVPDTHSATSTPFLRPPPTGPKGWTAKAERTDQGALDRAESFHSRAHSDTASRRSEDDRDRDRSRARERNQDSTKNADGRKRKDASGESRRERGRSSSRERRRRKDKDKLREDRAKARQRDTGWIGRYKEQEYHRPSDSRSSRHRSRSRDDHRLREKDRHRRRTSYSSSSSSSSDSEYERRRRKRREKRRRGKEERDRSSRRHKKEEHSASTTSRPIISWGKYGLISEADMFRKGAEFRAWLIEERRLNPEMIPRERSYKEFAVFVEDHNTATFPHEKYYDIETYHMKMRAIRSGHTLPMDGETYDASADLKAHSSSIKAQKRKPSLSREEVEDLRQIERERVEMTKLRQLGIDIPRTMGVRADYVEIKDMTFD